MLSWPLFSIDSKEARKGMLARNSYMNYVKQYRECAWQHVYTINCFPYSRFLTWTSGRIMCWWKLRSPKAWGASMPQTVHAIAFFRKRMVKDATHLFRFSRNFSSLLQKAKVTELGAALNVWIHGHLKFEQNSQERFVGALGLWWWSMIEMCHV